MSANHLIVDTSALLAYFDGSEPDHGAVRDAIDATTGDLIVSPYVVAELDYLLATRHGVDAELAVLDELSSGAWTLADFADGALRSARTIVAKYKDQAVGLADASNVVLAHRYGTKTIVTLDRRHFDVLRPIDGGRFKVLPA
ncbi:PIN domain-containing protein [Humibacter sp.]|uniref:PIN domain-containing protein n=1 Tax=Humibacter sp. TaxID=1940291 RepID=UPI003F7E723E